MKWIFTACLVVGVNASALELELPSVFSDHMVLQRQMDVPIWGQADAGATVDVAFAGQTHTTQVDAEGQWRLKLSPLKASADSRELVLTVTLGDATHAHTIQDVLVGEVWLNGGQSNMYRPFRMLVGDTNTKDQQPLVEYLRHEAATAHDPLLRQFRTGQVYSVDEPVFAGRGAWTKAVAGDVNEFSCTAYFFARELRRELGVPVAFLSCNLGGTLIEPWMPPAAFKRSPELDDYYGLELQKHRDALKAWDDAEQKAAYEAALKTWEEAQARGEKAGRKPRKPVHPERNKSVPGTLYHGMVNPLATYAIRGFLWYQGESNSGHHPEAYGERLVALIESWRAAWGQETAYFFWCQLASYKAPNDEPVGDEDGYAMVKNGQRTALSLPDTGMAVLNDIGDATDVHPRNKMDAGKRLSYWALNKVHGQDIPFSGPLYQSARVEGNHVIITFDHADGGLMTGRKHLMDPTVPVDEPLKRFQICGPDGTWHWAQAQISGGDTVTVSHPRVKRPREVRYAWAANADEANLYNQEGLPASMFKTGPLPTP